MQVEIWSDIVCPFCYIGKRKFEKALAQFAHKDEVEVTWKSFQLNPYQQTDPHKNMYASLAEHKGCSLEEAHQMMNYVTDMAKGEGLHYNFDKAVIANSLDAHRLIQMARQQGKGDEVKERLLKGYFIEGANIADHATLAKLGSEVGLNPEKVQHMLQTGEFAEALEDDIREAQQIGVRGVPFFLLNRKYAISGAQPVETMLEALKQTYSETEKEIVSTTDDQGASCDIDGACD